MNALITQQRAERSLAKPGFADKELLRFDDERLAPLRYVSGLYALLRAIDETMPKDATLYVEGTSLSPDVTEFLAQRPTATRHEVEAGTVRPKPKLFHLPLSGTNLGELREVAERHAEPGVCDHLVVYREGDVLLWAHDAGSGDVMVSRKLRDETVSRLEDSLGSALR